MEAVTIKPEDIEGYIVEEHYLNLGEVLGLGKDHPTRVMTACVLVLKNGFTVTGESGCADPRKYDQEIGRKIARANAVSKVWPLMGYVLRSKLAGMSGLIEKEPDVEAKPKNFKDRLATEHEDLMAKVVRLNWFLSNHTEGMLPEEKQDLMDQRNAMVEYADILGNRMKRYF